MSNRRPTISARLEVLERLARANRDEKTPDSSQFTSVAWADVERSSFLDGLDDLLAHQEERVAAEEQRKLEEVKDLALQRALQRARARRWEQEQMERAREERLERRIAEVKVEAAEEAEEIIADRKAVLNLNMEAQQRADSWEREVTEVAVRKSKRRWGVLFQSSLAAAALACVVGLTAWSQSESRAGDELAAQWDEANDQEHAAEIRVAELEAEIERRVNLTASEKSLLELELADARQELAAAEKAREEVDRRRPKRPTSPSRLAVLPTMKIQKSVSGKSETSSSASSVKVAVDEPAAEVCHPHDPLCFEL